MWVIDITGCAVNMNHATDIYIEDFGEDYEIRIMTVNGGDTGFEVFKTRKAAEARIAELVEELNGERANNG